MSNDHGTLHSGDSKYRGWHSIHIHVSVVYKEEGCRGHLTLFYCRSNTGSVLDLGNNPETFHGSFLLNANKFKHLIHPISSLNGCFSLYTFQGRRHGISQNYFQDLARTHSKQLCDIENFFVEVSQVLGVEMVAPALLFLEF